MQGTRRQFLLCASIYLGSVLNSGAVLAPENKRPAHFLIEERRIIVEYYHPVKKGKSKGLSPGLAKRSGSLPPGLQKKLDRDGRLPPGLQKRLEPLPVKLETRLPKLPEQWDRVILDRDIILIDRRTSRILDIIENVVGLATGQ